MTKLPDHSPAPWRVDSTAVMDATNKRIFRAGDLHRVRCNDLEVAAAAPLMLATLRTIMTFCDNDTVPGGSEVYNLIEPIVTGLDERMTTAPEAPAFPPPNPDAIELDGLRERCGLFRTALEGMWERMNDEKVQDGSTGDLVFDLCDIIAPTLSHIGASVQIGEHTVKVGAERPELTIERVPLSKAETEALVETWSRLIGELGHHSPEDSKLMEAIRVELDKRGKETDLPADTTDPPDDETEDTMSFDDCVSVLKQFETYRSLSPGEAREVGRLLARIDDLGRVYDFQPIHYGFVNKAGHLFAKADDPCLVIRDTTDGVYIRGEFHKPPGVGSEVQLLERIKAEHGKTKYTPGETGRFGNTAEDVVRQSEHAADAIRQSVNQAIRDGGVQTGPDEASFVREARFCGECGREKKYVNEPQLPRACVNCEPHRFSGPDGVVSENPTSPTARLREVQDEIGEAVKGLKRDLFGGPPPVTPTFADVVKLDTALNYVRAAREVLS